MRGVKYEVVSPDEELAVATGVQVTPKKKASPSKTTTRPTSSSWTWSVLKFLLILTLAILIVFGILAAVVVHAGHHVWQTVGMSVIPQITTDHPLDLQEVHLPFSEIRHIQHRLDEFHHALHHDKTPKEDLVLTEEEINGLICENDADDMCGHVYTTIGENMISADFSFPAEDAPGGKGRFFVGSKTMKVVPDDPPSSSYSMQSIVTARTAAGPAHQDEEFPVLDVAWNMDFDEQHVKMEIHSAEVFGWMATDVFVQRFFQGKNWADYLMCPHAEKALEHIEGITIGDGKIVVHVKK